MDVSSFPLPKPFNILHTRPFMLCASQQLRLVVEFTEQQDLESYADVQRICNKVGFNNGNSILMKHADLYNAIACASTFLCLSD